jgi:signal transduction histidine kinase
MSSRFGIRQKILFGMAGAVLAALLPTFLVVNGWLSNSVDRRVAEDFRRAEATFTQVLQMRASLLTWEGLAFAKSPKLFAAVETGDPATVQDVLLSEIPDVAMRDLYMVTGSAGNVLAGEGSVGGGDAPADLAPLVDRAIAGQTVSGVVSVSGTLYEAAASPILVADRVVGVLVVGNRIGASFVESLRVVLGSEVAMRAGGEIGVASLTTERLGDLEAQLGSGSGAKSDRHGAARVTLAGERYLYSSIPLVSAVGDTMGDFLLLQSLDHAMGSADELRRRLLLIAALAGFLALLLPVAISRGLARNIGDLIRGVREVKRGNYEHAIASRSGDEVGFLADVFDEMRLSLKGRMQEARQLTEDLRSKNVALQEALAKLEATQGELIKSEKLAHTAGLAAQLSHELNNPIYNIQTCVEILERRTPRTDRSREFIDLIHDEVRRMTKLTKQMLGFAKPARDEMSPTDMNAVLSDLLRISTRWLEERNVTVILRLAHGLPRVLASADQLRQVFLNLIVNATDAMPHGGRLIIETGARSGSVFAVIEDNGCGIPAENLNKIFDAFFTTKNEMSGVGLGLSITYGIVERHKGRIDVVSTVGTGSRFTVTIPAYAADGQTGAQLAARSEPRGSE